MDLQQNLLEIQRLSSYYRGRIIEMTTIIEVQICWAMGKHFACDEQRYKQLLELVLFEQDLSRNIEVFKSILTDYPDAIAKYPDINHWLGMIRTTRNILAHSRTVTDRDTIQAFDGETIYMKQIKNGKEKIAKYDKALVSERMKDLNKTFDALMDIDENYIQNAKK